MAKKKKPVMVRLTGENHRKIKELKRRDPMTANIQTVVNVAVDIFFKKLNTHDLEKA